MSFSLKRRLLIVTMVVAAVAFCGCDGSAAANAPSHPRAALRAAACPGGGESSIEGLRSTRARRGALAPNGTVWTTVCGADASGVLKGGPMNAALNGARADVHQICPMDALPPMLVILRYRTGTRRFILNMGGCPGVVLHDRIELSFTATGLKQVEAALTKTRAR
jgi:hypothetical protein